ncbi:hypothetical protein [Longispora albida]|uniref:hypothetical protein n=1 Tax=Longispora albida TaxID=203523 RepID=UPI0003701256|nr:hypothetical protein [Longispora albida]
MRTSLAPSRRSAADVLVGTLFRAAGMLLVLLGKTAWALVKFLARHPRSTAVLAVAGALVHKAGWPALAVVLALAGGVLAGWRGLHPRSFRRTVQPWIVAWWRRWSFYSRQWPGWAYRCKLTVRTEDGGEEAAQIRKVTVTPGTDRLLVRMPVGLQPKAFENAADALQHASGSLDCRIIPAGKPAHVVIEFQRRDVLAAVVPALPVPAGPASQAPLPRPMEIARKWAAPVLRYLPGVVPAEQSELSPVAKLGIDLGAVPVGIREDGNRWALPLLGRHVLVGGMSRSGKGSIIWSLMRHLAPAIRDGLVVVDGIDPKGGLELEIGKAMFARYEADDLEAMADLIEAEAADADHRSKLLRGGARKFTPSAEYPFRILLIDELASLTAYAPMAIRMRVEKALGLLLTKGAAPGFCVLGFVQEPSKDIVPMRGLFTHRVALALDTPSQVDMVLGDGMRDRGAYADQISLATPGVGYAKDDAERQPLRVRAAYVTDDEIRDMAETYPAPGITLAAVLGAGEPASAPATAPATVPLPAKTQPGPLLPPALLAVLNKATKPEPDASDGNGNGPAAGDSTTGGGTR